MLYVRHLGYNLTHLVIQVALPDGEKVNISDGFIYEGFWEP